MLQSIKLKRSAVPGKIPQVVDLQLGELALNTNDGKIYLKKDNGIESIIDLTSFENVGNTPTTLAGYGITDAATSAYVDSAVTGLIWHDAINEPDLIDDSLSTPPAVPTLGYTYIIAAAPTGAWAGKAGHAVTWNGTTWNDLFSRPVQSGDRFGVALEYGAASIGGGLVGFANYIMVVDSGTPGAVTYFPHAYASGDAVLCNNENSTHFGHSYTYSVDYAKWVEFSGPSVINAGTGLSYTGNTLSANILGGDITVDGSDNLVLSATGVGAGTFQSVTVDTKGRILAGSNPTTLAGYGITDALPKVSANLVGLPTAPTAPTGTNTVQIATTEFVANTATDLTNSFLAGAKKIVKLRRSAGAFIAQTNDNRLFSWGRNLDGVLGQGSTASYELAGEIQFPTEMSTFTIVDWTIVCTSVYVLFSNGQLYVWGNNTGGQLGLGNNTDQSSPTLSNIGSVTNLYYAQNGYEFESTQYRDRTAMFIKTSTGAFYACGYGASGCFAKGNTTSYNSWQLFLPPTNKIISKLWISSNPNISVFCKTTDNLIYAVGSNVVGQLGVNLTLPAAASVLNWVAVPYFTNNNIIDVDDIQCTGYTSNVNLTTGVYTNTNTMSTIVKTTSGNIYAAGDNSQYQLGNNSTTDSITFIPVAMPVGKIVRKVVKSSRYAHVIFTDNTYARWGDNTYGQLGTSDPTHADVRVPTLGTLTVTDIFSSTRGGTWAYASPVFLYGTNGRLYGRGDNIRGCLGLGNVNINQTVIAEYTEIPINMKPGVLISDVIITGTTYVTAAITFVNSSRIFAAGDGAEYALNTTVTGDKYHFRNLDVVID